ncbi:Aminopeptidase [Balamuthia mandrillaris]
MEAQRQPPQQQERSSSLKDVLLPRKVEPTQYDLTLQPNLLEFTFEGRVVIHLKVNESTNSIKLHSKDLRLSSAKLRLKPSSSSSAPSSAPSSDSAATAGEVEWEAQGITYDDKNETVTLEFDATLAEATKPQPTSEQQEAELDISYSGNLNDKLCGFYRNKYVLDGETRYGATTQFEPTDARRALPCWDEPAVKAVFRVTMVVPSDRVAISNMPIRSSIVNTENRTKTVEFEPTPIMSTYLLAFVVGEYDFIEDTTKEGVKMRCYTPVGKSEQGRFALNVAVQALSFFTEKFGIPYPLPKLDMIAITDFSAGAMENWGLVTYREAALLIDEKQSSGMRKQGVARTVSHELAHQWFGNLVTMDWWTWLWLNEGFARYVEHLSVNQLFPEWDIWTQFVGGVFGSALALDSLKNSHAIEVAVTHPGEINEIFDSISYAKGASVIRMLSFYLGEDTFLKGLNVYLTRHQYANATSDDLWKALTEVSGKPVEQIMEAWTRQVGYPVLTIKQKQVNEEEGTVTFTVHQQRFLASEKEREKEAEEVVWKVPISVQTEKGGDALQFFLVDQKTQEIAVRMQKDEWIKANARQTGVFRVEYEEELLQRLGRAVSSGSLPPSDILGLESDVRFLFYPLLFFFLSANFFPTTKNNNKQLYALCKSGKSSALTMKNYLEFIHQHMSTTRNYSLWFNISSHLDYLSRLLSHQPFSSLF